MSVLLFYYTHSYLSFLPHPFLWSRNVWRSHILCINVFEITSLFYSFMLLDSVYQTFTRILNKFSLIIKFKDCKQKQLWGFPAFLKLFYWVFASYFKVFLNIDPYVCILKIFHPCLFLAFQLILWSFYSLFTQNLNMFKFINLLWLLYFTYTFLFQWYVILYIFTLLIILKFLFI